MLRLVVLVWQALLWTFAVSHNRELSLRKATVIISIPTLVPLTMNAYSLVEPLLAT